VTDLEKRERRLKLLEDRRVRYEKTVHYEFTADEKLIGLIIGKQGEKLQRVASNFKVELRVLPEDHGFRRVRIYGNDEQSVRQALSELEYIVYEYPVCGQPGWASGRKSQQLREIAQRSGLHSAWFNEESSSIILCGLRPAIERGFSMLASSIPSSSPGQIISSTKYADMDFLGTASPVGLRERASPSRYDRE